MSWDTMMPLLLRNVVGDTGTTPKYTDDALNALILTAAQFLTFRLDLSQSYTIDIENTALRPDPTATATRDDAFINLITLKAACMLLTAEVRKAGQQAISIRDGTSAIDLRKNLKDLQSLAQTYCKELESAIYEYSSSKVIPGQAVLNPFKLLTPGFDCLYGNRVHRGYYCG